MGLAFGVLALTFAFSGVGYLVTKQPFATALRVATVAGFVAIVVALILWTAGGEGWAGYLETLIELEYTRHPWFWPGLTLMVGAIVAAYFLFRRFAPPERQQLGIVYLIAIPVCVVAYFVGFAAGGPS